MATRVPQSSHSRLVMPPQAPQGIATEGMPGSPVKSSMTKPRPEQVLQGIGLECRRQGLEFVE